MTVAIIASLYGTEFDGFVPHWYDAIAKLDRQPDQVIVQRGEKLPGELCTQARLQNEAAAQVTADWIWKLDIDDLAHPDALDGIDEVEADVWVMGYRLEGPETWSPEVLPNDEYLAFGEQVYPGQSAFRKEAFERVKGYPLIAYEDWGLWRRMAKAGCTFESSGRVHSTYRRHPLSRTETEFTPQSRPRMLREMLDDA